MPRTRAQLWISAERGVARDQHEERDARVTAILESATLGISGNGGSTCSKLLARTISKVPWRSGEVARAKG